MRTREKLMNDVYTLLKNENFQILEHYNRGSCYDIIARKGEDIYLIKVFSNVDTIKTTTAAELRLLAGFLHAKPLVIGERSGLGELEDSVIYSRHGIPIFSYTTFYEVIKKKRFPISYAAPGGFYVKIDNKLLRELRKKMDISLGKLARIGHVSRRTILMYEEGESAPSIDVILKIEEYLNVSLTMTIDPFRYTENIEDLEQFSKPDSEFKALISRSLNAWNWKIYYTQKSELDAITIHDNDIYLTGLVVEKKQIPQKAVKIAKISKLFEKESFLISKDPATTEDVEVPVIAIKDILTHNRDIKHMLKGR